MTVFYCLSCRLLVLEYSCYLSKQTFIRSRELPLLELTSQVHCKANLRVGEINNHVQCFSEVDVQLLLAFWWLVTCCLAEGQDPFSTDTIPSIGFQLSDRNFRLSSPLFSLFDFVGYSQNPPPDLMIENT